MSRPLRIEFPGAVYHVTSRGNRRDSIFLSDQDRHTFLAFLEQALVRFDACVWAYCLMDNHYHLVLQTRQANLSRLMRHLNGVFTQCINRQHQKVGHVFQGRFKALLVDRDAYLLEVCRYVELNPVRAQMVDSPQEWPWSSHRFHTGLTASPSWLNTPGLHGHLLGQEPNTAADRRRAAKRYAALVEAGRQVRLWDNALSQQIFVGNDAFVERMQSLLAPQQSQAIEIPRQQRRQNLTLQECLASSDSREQALLRAYTEGVATMSALARELGLSVSRVSRLIRRAEDEVLMGFKGKT